MRSTELVCPSDTYVQGVIDEMKVYKCDEFLVGLVYSSKWEAFLIDNILYNIMVTYNFSTCL